MSDVADFILPDRPVQYGPGTGHTYRKVLPKLMMTADTLASPSSSATQMGNFANNEHTFEFATDSATLWKPQDSFFEVRFKVQVKRIGRAAAIPLVDPDITKATRDEKYALVQASRFSPKELGVYSQVNDPTLPIAAPLSAPSAPQFFNQANLFSQGPSFQTGLKDKFPCALNADVMFDSIAVAGRNLGAFYCRRHAITNGDTGYSIQTFDAQTEYDTYKTTQSNVTATAYYAKLNTLATPVHGADPLESGLSREAQIGLNFQWNPLCMDVILQKLKYSLGGREACEVSENTSGQISAFRNRTMRSANWLSIVGSRLVCSSFNPKDLARNVIDAAGHREITLTGNGGDTKTMAEFKYEQTGLNPGGDSKDYNIKTFYWQPPISLFDITHGIPGGTHKFVFKFQPHWKELMYTNLARDFRGLDIEFDIGFHEMNFYAALVNSAERYDSTNWVMSLESYTLNNVQLPIQLSPGVLQTLRFSVPSSTVGLVFFMQDAWYMQNKPQYYLAYAHRPTPQYPEPGAFWSQVSRFQVTFAGKLYPEEYVETTAQYQDREWLQIQQDLGMIGATGGCESVDLWREAGKYLYFRTLRDPSDLSTEVAVSLVTRGNLGNDIRLFCLAIYAKALSIRGSDGAITGSTMFDAFGVRTVSAPDVLSGNGRHYF